jgi:hypothetical protein
MEENMNDSQLRQDIIDELEFDPSISGEHIGVGVDRNVVTLTGHVDSYAEKLAAIAAVHRIKGVHAIAENIECVTPTRTRPQMIRSPSERSISLVGMFAFQPPLWMFWYRTTAGSPLPGQSIGIINDERPKMTYGGYPGYEA